MILFQWPAPLSNAVLWSAAGGAALYLEPVEAGDPGIAPFHEPGRFNEAVRGRLHSADRVALARWGRAFQVRWAAAREVGAVTQHLPLCGRPLREALRVARPEPRPVPEHWPAAARGYCLYRTKYPDVFARQLRDFEPPAGDWRPPPVRPSRRSTINRGWRSWGRYWVAPAGAADLTPETCVVNPVLVRAMADLAAWTAWKGDDCVGVAFDNRAAADAALATALGRLDKDVAAAVLGRSWDRLGAVPGTYEMMTAAWFGRLVRRAFGRAPSESEYEAAGFGGCGEKGDAGGTGA